MVVDPSARDRFAEKLGVEPRILFITEDGLPETVLQQVLIRHWAEQVGSRATSEVPHPTIQRPQSEKGYD